MNRDADLQRAFELIEQDSLEEAQQLLNTVLASDPDNPDAWWLYAHAVTDPEDAQHALQNVTRIDPTYPGAQALLENLPVERSAPQPLRTAAVDNDFSPDFLDDLDDEDLLAEDDFADEEAEFDFDDTDADDEDLDFDDDLAGAGQETQPAPAGRRLILALIGLLVLVGAVVLVFVLNPFGPAPATLTPTQQVADVGTPTEEPTLQIIVPATETPPGLPPGGLLEEIYTAVSAFPFVEDSAVADQTTAGSTLTISICVESRRALRTFVPEVMRALATAGDNLQGRFETLGVRFVNCDINATLLYTAMLVDDAVAFNGGVLTASELQGRLISLQP